MSEPLYCQVERNIRTYIEDMDLEPGDVLPTEQEFIKKLNVSRSTLRHALNNLQSNGLISKQQGRGTFVTEPYYEENLTRLTSFTEDSRNKGQTPTSIVITNQLIVPSDQIAKDLHIGQGDRVFCLERIRMIDGIPIQISLSYLPAKRLNNIDLTSVDFTSMSLYQLLESSNIIISSALETIEATISTPRDQALLDLPPNSPILVNRRKVFNEHNELIEIAQARSRGTHHQVKIKLRR